MRLKSKKLNWSMKERKFIPCPQVHAAQNFLVLTIPTHHTIMVPQQMVSSPYQCAASVLTHCVPSPNSKVGPPRAPFCSKHKLADTTGVCITKQKLLHPRGPLDDRVVKCTSNISVAWSLKTFIHNEAVTQVQHFQIFHVVQYVNQGILLHQAALKT